MATIPDSEHTSEVNLNTPDAARKNLEFVIMCYIHKCDKLASNVNVLMGTKF